MMRRSYASVAKDDNYPSNLPSASRQGHTRVFENKENIVDNKMEVAMPIAILKSKQQDDDQNDWQSPEPPLSLDSKLLFPAHSPITNQNSPNYITSKPSSYDKRVLLYKTEMCRTFEETGLCRYGAKCQFAHDPRELRQVSRHPRYKTEICKTFWQLGTCPYGKRCCFIHNEAEVTQPTTMMPLHSNNVPRSTILQRAFAVSHPVLLDDEEGLDEDQSMLLPMDMLSML